MPTRTAAPKSKTTEVRSERYRIRFDRRAQAALCAQIAGACRLVWNLLLADCERRYRLHKEYGKGAAIEGAVPVDKSVSFFTLGKRFTDLRSRPDAAWVRAFLGSPWGRRYRDMDLSWLGDLPYAPLRYTAKYLADAYTRFFEAWAAAKSQGQSLGVRKSDGKPKGFPKYKAKFDRDDGFTIPDGVRMDGDRLHIPKVGWVRLEGSGLYRGCKAKQVRIRKEGTEEHPKWYAYVFHEVPVDRLKQPAWTGAVGVDRNVGQATDSEGEVYEVPDDPKLDANIKRKQRQADKARARSKANGQPMSNRGRRICGQLKKLQRKKKRRRENANHQASRKLADRAHTVVLEDLNTKAMTRSAKGTVEEPGKNVKQKAGLNRGILNTGWGRLERNLDYKAGNVVNVDAAYTSQTCSSCGHVGQENRRTQATFKCVACGYKANADHNAALNILERGLALLPKARGNGASARREALGPCLLPLAMDKSTSVTREQGMPTAQGPPGSGAWSKYVIPKRWLGFRLFP